MELIGRGEQQHKLTRLLRDACAGTARSIVITGEPGIGKSALVEWLCRQATDNTLLRARGHEADSGHGYLALRQLLRPILTDLDHIDDHLADALRSALRMSDESVSESLVSLATLELLSAASEVRPIVVALDDAHLFDQASLDVVAFVARQMISERVLMTVSLRLHETEAPDRFEGLERIELTGLDRPRSMQLLDACGRSSSDDGLLARCHGNPLALQFLDPVAGGSQNLPERLRLGFESQLRRLPTQTRTALSLIATAGSIEPEVCERALRILGVPVLALQPAVELGVMTSDNEFCHPLLRAAVLARHDGTEVHDALAEAYGETSKDRALIHRLHGSGPFDDALIGAAEAHANELLAHGLHADAHVLFELLARRVVDPTRNSELLRMAAVMPALAGRYASSLPLFERALAAAPSAERRARVLRSMAWSELWAGSTVEVSASKLHAELRLAEFSDADEGQAIACWGSLVALYATADLRKALAVLDEVPAGFDLGGDGLVPRLLAADPAAVALHDRFDRQRLDGTSGSVGVVDPTLAIHGELLLLAGDWNQADTATRFYLDRLREDRLDSELGPAIGRRLTVRLMLGDCMTAWGLAMTALERFPHDGSLQAQGALAAAAVGDEAATHLAEKCLAKGQRHGITAFMIDGSHRLGLIELAAGRPDQARPHMDHAWQLMTEHWFRHPGYAFARGDIAEVFALCGDRERAQAVITELEQPPFASNWSRGIAARARGVLGGDRYFEQAMSLVADSPWELARTLLAWARALPTTDKRRSELAHRAVDAFDSMGARPWAALGRGLLANSSTPGVMAVDVLAPLSQRERTVALAVARGLSNKQVSQELFISMKTVDAHLQQIYRKLDVRSRTQLAARCLAPSIAA